MDNEKKEEDHIAKLGKWLALLAVSSAASSAAREEQHDWQEFTFSDGHTEMVPWDLVEKRFRKREREREEDYAKLDEWIAAYEDAHHTRPPSDLFEKKWRRMEKVREVREAKEREREGKENLRRELFIILTFLFWLISL